MKSFRKVAVAVITGVLIGFSGTAAIAQSQNLRPATAVVEHIDRDNDIAYVTTPTGIELTIYGAEDYRIGDIVALTVKIPAGKNFSEAVVVDSCYSGTLR